MDKMDHGIAPIAANESFSFRWWPSAVLAHRHLNKVSRLDRVNHVRFATTRSRMTGRPSALLASSARAIGVFGFGNAAGALVGDA